MTFISRRDLLKRAAAVGAIAVPTGARAFQASDADAARSVRWGGGPLGARAADAARGAKGAAPHPPAGGGEPLENLTAAEADLLDAVVARLIPTDAAGPGATEARAVHYIDRALGGPL